MRLVLDTNVVVSASLWGGKPSAIIEAAVAERVRLITSPVLLAELKDVVGRRKLTARLRRADTSVLEIVESYEKLADVVSPAVVEAIISTDPDDDHVLACAKAAGAELIVTGDSHLLRLGTYAGIHIVAVDEALRRIQDMPPG